MNNQNRGLSKPKAEADNTDLGFDNSWYHAQPHPIIVYYHRVNITLRSCCLVHCIDLVEVFVEFIDSRVQHVELKTVQDSTFMVTTVSGMAKLLTENWKEVQSCT